ncbi:MAG: dockerin type I repeat-containing protein [Clostridia bacterium]|nr:dockerin type I repeat-containing protein [Clostridia bacterium]
MSKRILAIFISALMLLAVCPLGSVAAGWDGTASSAFSGGSGTKEDPYKISTAGDFALLLYNLDMGVSDYAGVYFRMTHDIYLNNETCKFIPDTGLVKVTDGTNVAFIGTGIKGDASGDNDLFDETASKADYWYASDESTDKVHHYDRDTVYGGELYFSHSAYANDRKAFKGVIDGENHVISGVFSYDEGNSAYADHNGLFFDVIGATVKNISIESSLFFGSAAAGFAGYAEDSIFNNLDFCGIVIGNGGIVAEAVNCDFSECINRGYVFGTGNVGGIVGFNQANSEDNYITYCDNEGTVIYQGDYSATGGVVGKNIKASVEYCENKGYVRGGQYNTGGIVGGLFGGLVNDCTNRGVVDGLEYLGGIVGCTDAMDAPFTITECTNYGPVSGTSDVGGILGAMNTYNAGLVEDCQNFSSVTGENMIGGIIGSVLGRGETDVTTCANKGYITAGTVVGGIIGSISSSNGFTTVSRCINQNEINARSNIGGIVGNLYGWSRGAKIEQCYNSAALTGEKGVGGILGYSASRELYGETDPMIDLTIESCYNSGRINTTEKSGGLVGLVERSSGIGRPLNIKTSYNVGDVVASGSGCGRLLGYSDCQINVVDCYYSIDESLEAAYGSASKLSDDSKGLTDAEMTESASFVGFDFEDVWEIGRYANYDYPTIIGLSHDTHAHNMSDGHDETHHWDECACGMIENKGEHEPELQDRGNGFSDVVCGICGHFLYVVENGKPDCVLGDVNFDGAINQYDYILVKRHYFGTRLLAEEEMQPADVNIDGEVNQYDYILIKRHYFGTFVIG